MKKTVMALFLIIFSLSFSMTKEKIEKERKRDRLETIENIHLLSRETQKQAIVYTTLFTSDVALEEISKYSEPFNNATKVVFIFPEIKTVKKYLPKVATLIKYVDVYILDGEVEEEYLENRDYEDYIKQDVNEVLKKHSNITVIKVSVEKEDLSKLVEDSLSNSLKYGNSVLNKYFNKEMFK